MVSGQLAGHGLPELPPDFQRMVEVETGIDPSPKHLIHQVPGVFKGVLMSAIGESLAIGNYLHAGGAEEVGNQA
jgi:hypothetical protein